MSAAEPRGLGANELEELRGRLSVAEETLAAIRSGSIDALVVSGPDGARVYTLASADRAFRELAERMTDGAATVSDDGTILWANRQLASLLRLRHERLVGRSLSDVLSEGADVASLLDAARRQELAAELDLRRSDGSKVPVRLSLVPVSIEGMQARAMVVSDLTERRLTEAGLRQEVVAAADRLALLLEAVTAQMPVGVIVAEPDGRIVYRNEEALRIVAGYPLHDRLPENREAAPAADLAPHEAALLDALAGRRLEAIEVPFSRAGERPIMGTIRADAIYDSEHRAIAAVCAISDVTARREAEALRDAFIDVTAHELKTPLTTVLAAVQTLATRDADLDPATRRELVSDAGAETLRLVHLVDDMLVLSRLERGTEFLIDEPVALEHVVRGVVAAENRRSRIAATVRLARTPVPVVRGEAPYVEQVLGNMLRNAAKYGGSSVEVVIEAVEGGVAVRVLDDGPGFDSPPSALFDLYFREPAAAKHASGGGIGLFVCRELVRLMGGKVWAARRPEGGAEFGFLLPLYEEADA